jgi:methylisocitrate lyase
MTTIARRAFRDLLAGDRIITQPVAFDALSALLVRRHGFHAVGLGGFQMGSHLGVSEPLLGLADIAAVTRSVTAASEDLAVMVDAGAGYGEPLHVAHSVRVLEDAGAASIHIEDQIYPKRAHYHKGIEHVLSAEEMVQKIETAVQARRDPDLAIVARSDAMRTNSYEEGIRRAHMYVEAGADVIMLFPNDDDEARRAPRDLSGVPLTYVNSAGNRLGRPVYSVDALHRMGYKIAIFTIALSIAAVNAIDAVLMALEQDGTLPIEPEAMVAGRQLIEDAIGLDRLYALESATVERTPA